MEALKLFIYYLIDRLSFGKGIQRNINGFSVYFPARWSRYFESDYEKYNVAFLKQQIQPGATVIDVGAHLGLMSVISSELAGPRGTVYAFEPSPSTFTVLNKVVQLNSGKAKIVPVQMAIAKEKGTLDFFLSSDEGSNSNSLVQKHELNRKAIRIPSTSLDQFVLERKINSVGLIKIDAEGSELDVLQGASEVIKKFRPPVILAVHPRLIKNNNQTLNDISTFIRNSGYRIFLNNKELSDHEFCAMSDFFDVHLLPIQA